MSANTVGFVKPEREVDEAGSLNNGIGNFFKNYIISSELCNQV